MAPTESPPGLLLRPLTQEDVAIAHGFTAALRWPHRAEDWAFALAAGEGLAVELEGRLAGTAIGWRYGPDFATIGFIIVTEAAQGRGIGRRLTCALLDRLGGRRGVLLVATEAGAPLYRSLGFAPSEEIHQHQGAVLPAAELPVPPGLTLRPLRPADHPAAVALDEAATGMPRGDLLRALWPLAEGWALERAGTLAGFALIRPFGRGEVLGPVVAPGAEAARLLVGRALAGRQGRFVRMDIPAPTGLGPYLVERGLARVSAVTGMVRGTPPRRAPEPGYYGLVSQSLG